MDKDATREQRTTTWSILLQVSPRCTALRYPSHSLLQFPDEKSDSGIPPSQLNSLYTGDSGTRKEHKGLNTTPTSPTPCLYFTTPNLHNHLPTMASRQERPTLTVSIPSADAFVSPLYLGRAEQTTSADSIESSLEREPSWTPKPVNDAEYRAECLARRERYILALQSSGDAGFNDYLHWYRDHPHSYPFRRWDSCSCTYTASTDSSSSVQFSSYEDEDREGTLVPSYVDTAQPKSYGACRQAFWNLDSTRFPLGFGSPDSASADEERPLLSYSTRRAEVVFGGEKEICSGSMAICSSIVVTAITLAGLLKLRDIIF
ncbi:uncharacterized protein F5Z01DRAFT_634461 [Emericellopsis atlantica]|uniref:Uncharacterized protein n=1 Tax=Emericellopsis atlantica TaxID=2614577 RepID=A0A9P7ZRC1_9HYPO|nr:uncharacterized protein F5Z01DRAFT_634461 [Emericellopsis atlantica]KAG9256898.1 hypothetical protein F5Z01DRAFT_634461 [Emericellopsis atlantica]